MPRVFLVAAVVALIVTGVVTWVADTTAEPSSNLVAADHPPSSAPTSSTPDATTPAAAPTATSVVTATTIPPATTTPPGTAPAAGTGPTGAAASSSIALEGCPPPPPPPPTGPPGPPAPPPWHPAVLVPDSALPPAPVVAPWASDIRPITGKGMWIWQWDRTEGGNADAVVKQATRAGLHQLWIRVGDSRDGFYAASELEAVVGKAHAAGLSVIGWGFPYLYDPGADAAWTARVLDWRSSKGDRVDGFSADLERSTEGVAMSAQRAGVYLGAVRQAAGSRLVVATVYPPLDTYWLGPYPYTAMAPYVDAFTPMVYWECTDPGTDAIQALSRLATLRPVHLLGQAYNMAAEGGRTVSPRAAEIRLFLDAGRRSGAIGASFWVWQSATAEEWQAVTAYPWSG